MSLEWTLLIGIAEELTQSQPGSWEVGETRPGHCCPGARRQPACVPAYVVKSTSTKVFDFGRWNTVPWFSGDLKKGVAS